MADVEHSTLTGADLHEPKGVASASDGQVYIADGAGTGAWRSTPHAAFSYSDVGTGHTLVAPTTYTLINPATSVGGDPTEFSHNSLGRLTYTGSETMDFTVQAVLTLKSSSASRVDSFARLYVSGSGAGSEQSCAIISANYRQLCLVSHVQLSTNDYIEVYAKAASGNIIAHSYDLSVQGHI